MKQNKEKIKIICKKCGDSFESYSCRIGVRFFCSRKCYSLFKLGKPAWNKGLKGFRAGEKRPWMSAFVGEAHWSYIKDRSLLQRYNDEARDRRSSAYNAWRKSVWSRDNLKCKILNKNCNDRIEAHHILSWREYPELRYQTNNGITLCHAHHPRKRAEEKRLIPTFQELVSVSKN